MGFLRRQLKNTTLECKLTAYKTLIRPTLEYASIIWDPHQLYLSYGIENIQNWGLRFIFSKYRRAESMSDLLEQSKMQSLGVRRIIARLKFIHQLYHGHLKMRADNYLRKPYSHSNRSNHSKMIKPYIILNDT
ncbi:unnamed protein product, partial [Ixodes hexagonus]